MSDWVRVPREVAASLLTTHTCYSGHLCNLCIAQTHIRGLLAACPAAQEDAESSGATGAFENVRGATKKSYPFTELIAAAIETGPRSTPAAQEDAQDARRLDWLFSAGYDNSCSKVLLVYQEWALQRKRGFRAAIDAAIAETGRGDDLSQ